MIKKLDEVKLDFEQRKLIKDFLISLLNSVIIQCNFILTFTDQNSGEEREALNSALNNAYEEIKKVDDCERDDVLLFYYNNIMSKDFSKGLAGVVNKLDSIDIMPDFMDAVRNSDFNEFMEVVNKYVDDPNDKEN